MNSEKNKIIDTFLFFNEIEMLKIRLEYLGPIIDYFVIAEADIDFAGIKKNFNLNKNIIDTLPFSEKIIYYQKKINFNSLFWKIRKIRYGKNKARLLWKLQDAQRNSLLEPLREFNQNDLIIFSDIDEFPSLEAIKFIQSKGRKNIKTYSCKQIFYYYDLNNAAINDCFYGSIFTDLKEFRKSLPHKIKSKKNDYQHIENGGWHFSYFMNTNKIREKIYAICDVENLSNFKSLSIKDIKEKIINSHDLYGRNIFLSNSMANAVPKNLKKIFEKYLPECTRSG